MTAKSVLMRPQGLRPRARAPTSPPLATSLAVVGRIRYCYHFNVNKAVVFSIYNNLLRLYSILLLLLKHNKISKSRCLFIALMSMMAYNVIISLLNLFYEKFCLLFTSYIIVLLIIRYITISYSYVVTHILA